jgi:hypothetical protein
VPRLCEYTLAFALQLTKNTEKPQTPENLYTIYNIIITTVLLLLLLLLLLLNSQDPQLLPIYSQVNLAHALEICDPNVLYVFVISYHLNP